jgi:hypothetical protein
MIMMMIMMLLLLLVRRRHDADDGLRNMMPGLGTGRCGWTRLGSYDGSQRIMSQIGIGFRFTTDAQTTKDRSHSNYFARARASHSAPATIITAMEQAYVSEGTSIDKVRACVVCMLWLVCCMLGFDSLGRPNGGPIRISQSPMHCLSMLAKYTTIIRLVVDLAFHPCCFWIYNDY